MRPDDQHTRRTSTPLVPQRSFSHTSSLPQRDHLGQAATANVARSQLDSIYSSDNTISTSQTLPIASNDTSVQPPLAVANPYERNHATIAEVQADQWKQYHSAWQDYYQQYYERYYVGQIHHARQALEARVVEAAGNKQPAATARTEQLPETLSHDEAIYDLRSKLLSRMEESAKKARKSRHFIPIAAALCVVVLFLFLQYNRVLFANVQAYISPGDIDPANIIIDPSTNIAVSPEPKLIIPKINVDVPVNYTTAPDYDSQMKAMEGGVAYFGIPGANSKPGQVGNTVLSGHSSNDIIDQGNYKFIFARLDHLAKGDTIYVNYEAKRYTYTITRTEVVKPAEVSKLVYPTDKPVLTLITCTPIGTALNRLLVTAEQVSPSPKDAPIAPDTSAANNEPAAIPGNSPTFVQRLLNGGDQ